MACLSLTLALNVLAERFGVTTYEEGLRMAGALLLIDACLNARCARAAWRGRQRVPAAGSRCRVLLLPLALDRKSVV